MNARRPRLPQGAPPVCSVCGSGDLTYQIETWKSPAPAGALAAIGCQFCKTWWDVQATRQVEDIFTPGAWQVLACRQGAYPSPAGRGHPAYTPNEAHSQEPQ